MTPPAPLSEIQKRRIAELISDDVEHLAEQGEAPTLVTRHTWDAIERLAKRLELFPRDLAALLVLESQECSVDETRDEGGPA